MIEILVAAIAFAYLFVAGVIQKNFKPWRVRECRNCQGARRCDADHAGAAFFAGVLWPLALPMSLGIYGTAILGMSNGGKTKAERRREEEIAEAEHRLELARISQKQTEALERAAL